MKIVTNHHPRPLVHGYELTPEEKKEFDFLTTEELEEAEFFRYGQWTHYLGNFLRTEGFPGWDGFEADSAFTGTLVKLCDDGESVIVGRAMS
jgi:hypothetical protein